MFLIVLIALAVFPLPAAPVEIHCSPHHINVFQGEKVPLHLTVKNNLPVDIQSEHRYFLSYHIYDRDGEPIQFHNRRYIIPVVLKKKSTTRFVLPVYFEYPRSGDYIVEVDIVKEGEFWGADKKWKTDRIYLGLKKLVSREFKNRYLTTFYLTRNSTINRIQYLLRMILKNNEIVHNNKIIGFSPGSNYPQIWIRDTATFINLARYHYPRAPLERSLELFLVHQRPNGEIPDWVDVDGRTDKNTVSTDQESSLVIAAFELATENPRWLSRSVGGIPVHRRLEKALEWVWKYRRDPNLNLISSGLTADWGDVENSYPDQRATKLSPLSQKVFSIYTQSKYIQAMERMVRIHRYLNKNQKARKWKQRLETVSTQTKKRLYLKNRGYFLIHYCPQPHRYVDFERQILAVGGNAEAMLAGLMDRDQIRQFIQVLEKRREKHRLPNVSFCLIPPYPAGFFPHPAMKNPWVYQNGGQWDWIGGRLVKALFLNSFREKALQYLLEIIKKNLKNFTIFEWEDKNGYSPWGAKFYTGAAGVIGDAILNGYLRYSQTLEGHRFATLNEWYFLKIGQKDRIAFLRADDILVYIQRLRNRKVQVITHPQRPPFSLCNKGIYVIDTDNPHR